MKRFIQLHILTSYPPANLNRDDLGRPKTAKMGGVDRLRVSSQSLKRTWRTSAIFQSAMSEHIGTRTKRIGLECYKKLIESDVTESKAMKWSIAIAGVFGKTKKESKNKPREELETEQLVHISPKEQEGINRLIGKLVDEKRDPDGEDLKLLRKDAHAVDIALFGRMLASSPAFNVEAACQVAHAISVHPVVVEDDYFTAVDDLNSGAEDLGAGHIGETGFAAGLFYSYVCINREQLVENLGENSELAGNAIAALVEAAVKVAPTGKQNSFGSHAYASYLLAEVGDQQPRSLAVSFLKPIEHRQYNDFAAAAIAALKSQRSNFEKVYGACADDFSELDVHAGEGSLQEVFSLICQ